MTSAVLALVSAVQANTDAVNAAVAAIQAGTGGVDPTDAPAIAAAVTQITANTDAITAALGGVGHSADHATDWPAVDRGAASGRVERQVVPGSHTVV